MAKQRNFYKTMYGTEKGKRVGRYGNVKYESNGRRTFKGRNYNYDNDPTGIYDCEDWL